MNNNDKFHFFIGNIFHDEEQINILRKIQKKLRKKYFLKQAHWNTKFFTNMIYLGYFNNDTAIEYMENSIKPLLIAIGLKFSKFNCKYTGYKIENDKSFYKISLNFMDEQNYLENIILPYLYENGILPIYNKKKSNLKPAIELIYYKSSAKLNMKQEINSLVPEQQFNIDHISLIRGIPIRYRVGTPSVHDQMNLEEISRYTFPLANTSNTQTFNESPVIVPIYNAPQISAPIYNQPLYNRKNEIDENSYLSNNQ